jgi:hypothetical protein
MINKYSGKLDLLIENGDKNFVYIFREGIAEGLREYGFKDVESIGNQVIFKRGIFEPIFGPRMLSVNWLYVINVNEGDISIQLSDKKVCLFYNLDFTQYCWGLLGTYFLFIFMLAYLMEFNKAKILSNLLTLVILGVLGIIVCVLAFIFRRICMLYGFNKFLKNTFLGINC